MKRLRSMGSVLIMAAVLPTVGSAQALPVGFGPRAVASLYRPSVATFLSPSVDFLVPLGRMRATADFASVDANHVYYGGGVDANLRMPGAAWLTLQPSVYTYDAGPVAAGGREAGTRIGFGLTMAMRNAGFWVSPVRDVRTAGTVGRSALHLGGGAWVELGKASLSLSVSATSFADTLPVVQTEAFRFLDAFTFERRRWTLEEVGFRYVDAEVGVEYGLGPMRLGVGAGLRGQTLGVDHDRWIRLNSTVALSRSLELDVTGGVRGGRPEQYLEGGRFVAVGFRWRGGGGRDVARQGTSPHPDADPAAAAVEVVPASDGEGAGLVRFPGIPGRHVELAGDLTDWAPIELVPTSDGFWTLTRHILPGTYHIMVRSDGGVWHAPPGVPTLENEFGTRVGLLLIH